MTAHSIVNVLVTLKDDLKTAKIETIIRKTEHSPVYREKESESDLDRTQIWMIRQEM
jgi:hypothetical protein